MSCRCFASAIAKIYPRYTGTSQDGVYKRWKAERIDFAGYFNSCRNNKEPIDQQWRPFDTLSKDAGAGCYVILADFGCARLGHSKDNRIHRESRKIRVRHTLVWLKCCRTNNLYMCGSSSHCPVTYLVKRLCRDVNKAVACEIM